MVDIPEKTIDEKAKELEAERTEAAARKKRRHRHIEIRNRKSAAEKKDVVDRGMYTNKTIF
jgi:hypothetical protein